ncbi:hypothetical protein D3C87_1236190 [compost metagenome]
MENDIIFTDKVYQFGFITFPVFFPAAFIAFVAADIVLFCFRVPNIQFGIVTKLFSGRNITYRGIEPHIKHFAFCIAQWNTYAPF